MPKEVTCPTCSGNGLVDCPKGHGLTGPSILYCNICNAKGIVVCPTCKGNKKIEIRDDKKPK